jgi:hypothetical protein
MSVIKAAQHKYTHRKMIGRDPKTNRIRYRYYYAEHHGGGITSANIEEGSAFKLTYKGRRGHFHVQRVEGDKVYVKHDGRPNAKEVEMTKGELRALLKRQHETIENKKREKAQENRRKARKTTAKKRKSTKRKKTQTTAPKKTMRSYIAEQDEKINSLRAQIERLEQEEKSDPRVNHFDEIYKIKEEIGTRGRVRSIAQNADSLNNPKSFLNTLKDPRDRTKRVIPLEAYNEIIGILEGAVETQTTAPREQLTETAQAFSGLLDAIKSGERSQAAQNAFKTELNRVIDKTESGTLTDAERAELLPIAEQLVEATSGRARGLMTAVRDQIKGVSEDGETAQATDTRNPIARAVDQATPAHTAGYSSDAQGGLTISGFVAERYGYPTKKEAVADAKAKGHSVKDVVSVSNRFWTGYAISRIDPVTKERVFFDKTSAEPEAIRVPLADKTTHHRRGHLFDEGGDIRTTQRVHGFKV